MSHKSLEVGTPTGVTAKITFPEEHEEELVELAVRSLLGSLVGIAHAPSPEVRRQYLIRYVSGLVSYSELELKRIKVAQNTEKENASHIVENLLKSLGNNPPKPKKDPPKGK
jgi:hypothetical protein